MSAPDLRTVGEIVAYDRGVMVGVRLGVRKAARVVGSLYVNGVQNRAYAEAIIETILAVQEADEADLRAADR